jgi:hypothetical protein
VYWGERIGAYGATLAFALRFMSVSHPAEIVMAIAVAVFVGSLITGFCLERVERKRAE